MFGVDWDGEDKLFDDMITLDILDDEDEGGCKGGYEKLNGSCLVFLLMMGSAVALPIVGLVKIFA